MTIKDQESPVEVVLIDPMISILFYVLSISESTAVLNSELYSCKYMLDNVFWPVR